MLNPNSSGFQNLGSRKPTQNGDVAYQPSQAQSESFWRDQKLSVLRGEANYTYAVGPGYETIPRSHVTAGFGQSYDDGIHADATTRPDMSANLPTQPANIYEPHRDMHSNRAHGYHVMSPQEVMIDLAPIQNNQRLWQIGQLGECMRGLAKEPLGEILTATQHHTFDTHMRAIDPGVAPAMLTDGTATKTPLQGQGSYVPHPQTQDNRHTIVGTTTRLVPAQQHMHTITGPSTPLQPPSQSQFCVMM